MKTLFILNPKAGKGNRVDFLAEKIKRTAYELKSDADVYVTKAVGDAEAFVKNYREKYGSARFIACGGDGTFSEVLNGAVSDKKSFVGVMPIGTGNDFCRNFGISERFSDIKGQLLGKSVCCDAIRYQCENSLTPRYCANMFNIGFDCNVADMTAKMKQKPFISGSLAYFLSIFAMLIKKKGARLKIELDGKEMHDGALLLTSLANGSFCGGGIKSNPLAEVTDGYMDINIIYNVSRLNFISKLPFYMKGTHINLKNIERIINTLKCRKAVITPIDGNMRLCIDGEITDAGRTEFEIVPEAFNFILPV